MEKIGDKCRVRDR